MNFRHPQIRLGDQDAYSAAHDILLPQEFELPMIPPIINRYLIIGMSCIRSRTLRRLQTVE